MKRDLVDILYLHGLSVSYDRVLQISTNTANKVIAQFETENLVCPPKMKLGLFTTGNLDNIDHNPTSNSAVPIQYQWSSTVWTSFKMQHRTLTLNNCLLYFQLTSLYTPLPNNFNGNIQIYIWVMCCTTWQEPPPPSPPPPPPNGDG